MTVVAASVVVAFDPNGGDVFLEVFKREVLAPSHGISEWAKEEELPDEKELRFRLIDAPAGVYHVLAMYRLSSGISDATMDGPGEGWTEAEPMTDLYVTKLSWEEFAEYEFDFMDSFTDKDRALYFAPTTPAPFAFKLPT